MGFGRSSRTTLRGATGLDRVETNAWMLKVMDRSAMATRAAVSRQETNSEASQGPEAKRLNY